jgi:predicted flap endonuclease-1-like 5' DNA nuclease
MLDGVGWAAAEIVWFMIVATMVGFAIGWIFGRWLQRASIAEAYEAELVRQEELARKAEHRLVESNNTLDKLQRQLRGESEKVGELELQVRSAQEAIADLEAGLAAAGGSDEAFVELREQRDAAIAQAEERGREVNGLRDSLESAQASVVDLEKRLAAAEGDAAAARGLQNDLDATSEERQELTARLAALSAELEDERGRIGMLESELDLARRTAAEAQGLRAELEESNVDRQALSARVEELSAALAATPRRGPTKEDAVARMADIAERTAGGGPAPDDDLKTIRGIGPKLEKTLKELGITSYRQIANFDGDDVEIVTAALSAFKGRIERDNWMAGAAEQHLKKYGEPA